MPEISEQELSNLKCDAERLREIEAMLEPPYNENPTTMRVRELLTELRLDKARMDYLADADIVIQFNDIDGARAGQCFGCMPMRYAIDLAIKNQRP